MFENAMMFLQPILAFAAEKYGAVGTVCAYLIFAVGPAMSVLIEVMDGIVMFTATKKDDEVAAKIKAGWAKILKFLEIVPHVNIPISPGVTKALVYLSKGAKAILGAIKGLSS